MEKSADHSPYGNDVDTWIHLLRSSVKAYLDRMLHTRRLAYRTFCRRDAVDVEP